MTPPSHVLNRILVLPDSINFSYDVLFKIEVLQVQCTVGVLEIHESLRNISCETHRERNFNNYY